MIRLCGHVDRRGNNGQSMASVQFLGRRGVKTLLERLLECTAFAIVGEQLEHIFVGKIPYP